MPSDDQRRAEEFCKSLGNPPRTRKGIEKLDGPPPLRQDAQERSRAAMDGREELTLEEAEQRAKKNCGRGRV